MNEEKWKEEEQKKEKSRIGKEKKLRPIGLSHMWNFLKVKNVTYGSTFLTFFHGLTSQF